MFKDYINSKKNRATYICFIALMAFSVLGIFISGICKLTCIYEFESDYATVFSSIYSIYTMPTLIVPLFFLWISNLLRRNQNVLYQVRFESSKKIALHKLKIIYLESLSYNIVVFLMYIIREIGLKADTAGFPIARLPLYFILQVMGFSTIYLITCCIYEWRDNLAAAMLIGYIASSVDFYRKQTGVHIRNFFTVYSLYVNPFVSAKSLVQSFIYMLSINVLCILVYFAILEKKQYYGR